MVSLALLGGVTHYKNVEDLIDKNYVQTGLLIRLWLPLLNEKLFLKTGIIHTKLEFENGYKTYYKLPTHIEYIYPKGKIKPTLSYGLNFYFPANRSVSFTGGINYALNEKISLSFLAESEFNSFGVIFPESFLSYSFHTGLFIKF